MKFTTSLTKNYEFRRLYNKGKSAASKYVVVYCIRNNSFRNAGYGKNNGSENRLGITVSTKLGGAVQRNRIRRRLKEVYRLNESSLRKGYSIVLVARQGSRYAEWNELTSSVLSLFNKLGLMMVSENVNNNAANAANAN